MKDESTNRHASSPQEKDSKKGKSLLDTPVSRQQLLKAGWIVPAVIAINLPTAVHAQAITAPSPKKKKEP